MPTATNEDLRVDVVADLTRFAREIEETEKKAKEAGKRAGKAYGDAFGALSAESQRRAERLAATSGNNALAAIRQAGAKHGAELAKQMAQHGEKAGRMLAEALRAEYDKRISTGRQLRFEGKIDDRTLRARAREAAHRFNAALISGLQELKLSGAIDEAEFNRLARRLRSAGLSAGRQMSQGVESGGKSGLERLLVWVKGIFAIQLGQLIGRAVRSGVNFLRETADAALEVERSYLRLQSAAKLYGVEQSLMNELSERGRKEMQLSVSIANELAIQAARIAGRAGEAARAQELWAAALDLGSANGLKATEVALALEQSFRGVDEGLNRLGLQDPSGIYREFAREIGASADALTDAQKQQAIMNAIIEAGTTVQGEYQRQLDGNIGKMTAWENRVRTARETIGDAFLPVLVKLTDWFSGPLSIAVSGVTSLLESFLSPLERLARQMERMGASADLILPLTLQDRINDTKGEILDLQDEIDRLTAPTVTLTTFRESRLADLTPAQLVDLRRELQSRQERAAAEGRTETAESLLGELEIVNKLISTYGLLDEKKKELAATEEALADANERRDLRLELNETERLIDSLTRQGAEYNELNDKLEALVKRRDELRAILDPPKAPTDGGGGGGPEPLSPEIVRQMESARRALEERIRAWEAMAPLREMGGAVPAVPEGLEAQLQRILEIDTEIRDIEEDIRRARGTAPAGIQQLIEARRQERSVLQERVQAIRDQWANLPQVQAQLSRVLAITQDISGAVVDMGAEGWQTLDSAIDGVTRAIRDAADAEAELQRARLSGDPEKIARALQRQADAQRAVERATARAMRIYEAGADSGAISQERLNELIQEMIDLLKAAGIEIEGVTEKQRDWGELARNIESLGRGVLSVADAMGVLDDRSRRTLQGLIDVGSAIAQIAQNPANIAAWAQGIGGAVGIIKGLFGGSAEDRARVNELREAMRSLTDALHALRTAVLSEISLAEKQRIETAGENFLRRFGPIFDQAQRLGFGGTPATITGLTQADFDFLRDLEELTGTDFFDERAGTIIADAFEAAWEAFQRMDVAGFAKDLTGRLDAIDYAARIAGDALGSAADQMDLFLDTVRDFSPEFATQFERILTEQGMDAARAWLQQQAVLFAEGGAEALGAWARNLTPGEIQRIIDEGLERTAPGGVTGGGPESTRLGVSITEVQASSMLAELSTQTYHLAGIHSILRGGSLPLPSLPSITPPSPASLDVAGMVSRLRAGGVDLRGATFEVHFDGEPPPLSSPAQWEAAGSAFGRGFGQRLADIAAGAGIDRARIEIRGRAG